MRELVLDHGALPQRRASCGRVHLLAQSLLQRLVLRDRDGAAMPEFRGGALTTQRAAIADVGVEFDNRAQRERCIWPFGHSIVWSRRFSVNADLGNSWPL